MACSRCGETADLRRFAILSGSRELETWLCARCCRQAGVPQADASGPAGLPDAPGGFASREVALSLFFRPLVEAPAPGSTLPAGTACPVCRKSLSRILGDGLAGCPECYRHFAASLDPLVGRLHGGRSQRGKGGADRHRRRPPAGSGS